jgi:hypothetical protein
LLAFFEGLDNSVIFFIFGLEIPLEIRDDAGTDLGKVFLDFVETRRGWRVGSSYCTRGQY